MDRQAFLDQFPWDKSVLTSEQGVDFQQLLINSHDVFAKQRFDIGYNTEHGFQSKVNSGT